MQSFTPLLSAYFASGLRFFTTRSNCCFFSASSCGPMRPDDGVDRPDDARAAEDRRLVDEAFT